LGAQPDFKPNGLQDLSESDALRALMQPGELSSGA
jgi:hypothetical protein